MFGSHKQSRSKFCKIITDRDQQKKCHGCKLVAGLLRGRRVQRSEDPNCLPELSCQFHTNYQELSECAKKGCVSCRVFQRALLLSQITFLGVKGLENAGEVWARLPQSANKDISYPGRPTLEISVRSPSEESTKTGKVFCMDDRSMTVLNLELQTPIKKIKEWLSDCHQYHTACSNLRQSQTNPSRLIEILNPYELRLVDLSKHDLVDYATLSYQWKGRGAVADLDEIRINGNCTDSENTGTRHNKFSIQDLSSTIRDAIQLAHRLDLSYLWADSVCIPKGDWNNEASKMNLVYGNAYVTFCTCSSERAVDGLLHTREAWKHPNEACRLDEQWLITEDMSLNEVRGRAPLFTRGWVLQEERLSPRVLYLCSQRVYWSCVKAQHTEMGLQVGNSRQPLQSSQSSYLGLRQPQLFLETRRQGNLDDIHQQWLEMVKDYVHRELTESSNRFDAISGLATQYLMAYKDSNSDEVRDEEYLAGLWRMRFSQDLAWSVANPKCFKRRLTLAPTWSWASLPLSSNSIMPEKFSMDSNDPDRLILLTKSQLGVPGQHDEPLDVVRRGALVKSVQLEGLFRRFVPENSTPIKWSEVQVQGREDEYNFSRHISTSIHCRNTDDGRVLFYEPHKVEIVGQLDYLYPVEMDLRSLYCLRLGKDWLLLLEAAPRDEAGLNSSLPVYRRVGVCNGYRENFFWHTERKKIALV